MNAESKSTPTRPERTLVPEGNAFADRRVDPLLCQSALLLREMVCDVHTYCVWMGKDGD